MRGARGSEEATTGCQVWSYLGHVDGARGEGLIAQDGPVLVALAPLQHDLQLVPFSFQEMRILMEGRRGECM